MTDKFLEKPPAGPDAWRETWQSGSRPRPQPSSLEPLFAFVRGPGVVVGFHPADEKYPGGIGGTSAYWEVEDLNEAVTFLTERGVRLYRGPYRTDFVAAVALMFDPFGCTVGLNQSTEESRRSVLTQFPQAGT